MQIKNFQLIPPGGKYVEKELEKITISHWLVVTSYKNNQENLMGFTSSEEALTYMKDCIQKELDREEENAS